MPSSVNSSSMGAPGVDEVKWLAPIRPGRRACTLRATVLETRVSKSRPDMGFVRFEFEMFNAARRAGDDADHVADDGAARAGAAAS